MAAIGTVLSSLLLGSGSSAVASSILSSSIKSSTKGTSAVSSIAINTTSSLLTTPTSRATGLTSSPSSIVVVTQTVTSTNSAATVTVTSTPLASPAASQASSRSSSASLLSSISTTPVAAAAAASSSSTLLTSSSLATSLSSSSSTSAILPPSTLTGTAPTPNTINIKTTTTWVSSGTSGSVSLTSTSLTSLPVISSSVLSPSLDSSLTAQSSSSTISTSTSSSSSLLSSTMTTQSAPSQFSLSSFNSSNTSNSLGSSTAPFSGSPSDSSSLSPSDSPSASFWSVTSSQTSQSLTTSSSSSSSFTALTASATVTNVIMTSPGLLNPLASNNVAAYFGHATGTYNASLADLCNSTNVDIIILGFVRWWWPKLYYPDIDFQKTCDSAIVGTSMTSPRCPQLAAWISNCQAAGKKIFLSVGGSTSNTTFSTAQDAIDAATTLWYFFGEGSLTWNARPFGSTTIDGVDIDAETGSVQYYDVFAAQLRQYFSQSSKRYFISAAPSCNNQTASLPIPLGTSFYQQVDFIWPRFYNSAVCSVGTAGFQTNLAAWVRFVASIKGYSAGLPKLYIGAYAWNFGKAGYVDASSWQSILTTSMSIFGSSGIFGGSMLWDGTKALQNGVSGGDYLSAIKAALNATSASAFTS